MGRLRSSCRRSPRAPAHRLVDLQRSVRRARRRLRPESDSRGPSGRPRGSGTTLRRGGRGSRRRRLCPVRLGRGGARVVLRGPLLWLLARSHRSIVAAEVWRGPLGGTGPHPVRRGAQANEHVERQRLVPLGKLPPRASLTRSPGMSPEADQRSDPVALNTMGHAITMPSTAAGM